MHLDPVVPDGFMRSLFRSSVHGLHPLGADGIGATVCVFLVVLQLRVIVACAHHGASIAAAPAQYGVGQRVQGVEKPHLRKQRLVERCTATDDATRLLHGGPDGVQKFNLGLASRAEALADFYETENAGTVFVVN